MKRIYAFILAVLMFAACALPSHAAEASDSDVYSTGIFEPCEYIPSFAEVPDFYTPVETVTCMYMFIDGEGNPHRRWYGSIDGAYGWYAVPDGEQWVRDYSMPVNVEDDRAMLYRKMDKEYSSESDLGYVGILPPEESRTKVSEIFGMPVRKFVLTAGISAAVLCVAIMISGIAAKNRRKRRWHF